MTPAKGSSVSPESNADAARLRSAIGSENGLAFALKSPIRTPKIVSGGGEVRSKRDEATSTTVCGIASRDERVVLFTDLE